MSDIDHEAIRRRVEKRMKQRQEFFIHFAIYIAINLVLWVVYLFNLVDPFTMFDINEFRFPYPLLVMIAWGIGLLSHGLDTYFKTSDRLVNRREDAIQREIERERARLGLAPAEFQKSKRRARLGEDGELVYDDERDPVDDDNAVPARTQRSER
ncbi:MAG TPA: 2TM domain-containing protein [Aggregatilineales bacterium]|nr:2TM domain-containing protein [Anaerolineales bacterium]HRE47299.1 2TM domain-containing protein [Aggregatilineales bacterium]